MASKGAFSLHETFHAHILESRFLCHNQCNLGKLGSVKQSRRAAEGILGSSDVNVAKERKGLHVPILVHSIIGHIHVPLADRLTLDASEMYSFLLGIVLDDLYDGKSIDGKEMGVRTIPDSARGWRRVVQIHTHSRLLGSLSCKDIN